MEEVIDGTPTVSLASSALRFAPEAGDGITEGINYSFFLTTRGGDQCSYQVASSRFTIWQIFHYGMIVVVAR